MAGVHHVFLRRAGRYLDEYERHIQAYDKSRDPSLEMARVGHELRKHGKIKKDRVAATQDAFIQHVTGMFAKHCVIRQDNVVVSSRLSANYDPVYTVVATLQPSRLTNVNRNYTTKSLIVGVNNCEITKDAIILQETLAAISIQYHAIARFEEHKIESNPLDGIAANLANILIFGTLFCVLASEPDMHLHGFALPYGQHLMLGQMSGHKMSDIHSYQNVIRIDRKGVGPLPKRTPAKIFNLDIRTVVEYNLLKESQDKMRDELVKFADDHIEELNVFFEYLYMGADHSVEYLDELRTKLVDDFMPIYSSYEWQRYTKD